MRYLGTLAVLVSACEVEDRVVVEPGIVEHYGAPVAIEAPSTVAVGAPVIVSVTTYGDGCISFDRTAAEVTTEGADVFPFDRRSVASGEGSSPCPAILLQFLHEVTLTFDAPGTKTIRIHGRRVDRDVDEDIEIPIDLVVE